ncbi:hypothetical protein THAOC_33412 [Thalassiosira oceanica]|uniref:Uncharacterized protein n=1 Tax=Thalassiosira oceanica TaxID=159749 RepID=K0R738_THAOC|nr:hypothetical protein THAOC_33412 [Thalassiosira oceanica]|eukprot:EJK47844.1 hypothetical protein THAOC_33412 [Thalassiosira oceanica]
MASAERNAEIWSTRLQREILALESKDDGPNKIELLPPFIKTIGHILNLEGGIAKVEFQVDVEVNNEIREVESEEEAAEQASATGNDEEESSKTAPAGNESKTKPEQQNDHGETETKKEGSVIILVLDASLYWKPDASNSEPPTSPQCYPFIKPLAILKDGSSLFSGGSTVENGDEIDIDLDWTPSIHLSDAVMNVALKIRECVKRGEPLHPAKRVYHDEGFSGSLLREAREAKESILETKKAVGAMFSTISAKGSTFAAKSSKGFLKIGETLSTSLNELASVDERNDVGLEGPSPESPAEVITKKNRPKFVVAAMAKAPKDKELPFSKSKPTAGSMFSRFAQSAKSVMEETFLMITDKFVIEFKSNKLNIGTGTVTFIITIDQMAKLKFRREESLSLFFKLAPDDPLVYMCPDSAYAVQDIQSVLKRHGVKGKHTNAATQKAVQMALNLVALIQHKEKELIDHPTTDRVNEIMDLYRQAAEKFESAGDPRHSEVMSHMQRFLSQQFTTSILDGTFIQETKKDATTSVSTPVGEVLEQPSYNLSNEDDEDDDADRVSPVKTDGAPEKTGGGQEDPTLKNMEMMMKEACADLSDLGMKDDEINDILTSPPKQSSGEDGLAEHDDAFAELDAMLSDADKELNELLSS